MDLQLAMVIAHDTRARAVTDARTDLDRLQRRAVDAGREESRRLVKVTRIDPVVGQARYRPAGRLLRDWYLHCYLNGLRGRLGNPAVTIDAQQVEDTAALLHRLTPTRTPRAALRAVAVLRDLADADAARATLTIITSLHATAARRAITHAPDGRFDADPVRVHVTRHWYLHCYLDHLQTATRTQPPQPALDDAAIHQIATILTTRTIQPLVWPVAAREPTADRDRVITDATVPDRAGAADDLRLAALQGPAKEAARALFNHAATLDEFAITDLPKIGAGTDRLTGLAASTLDVEPTERGMPQIRHA
ncbi:hypothetical protein [Microlunatus ginsengisoli]|uniref:Uncharacterized protein n=1 Tax=Microlunatus ginsengisoli TaxID=363863 RepID=A0ABP7A2J3_9ACTN